MTPQLVSLLVCTLLVSSSQAQGGFPMMGGLGNPSMLNSFQPYQNQNWNQNQQQEDPHLMTCISADMQDRQSQIRLTIRPADDNNNLYNPLGALGMRGLGMGGLGMGGLGMGHPGQHDPRRVRDWTVNGMMLPSQTVQKAGTYQVAVFEGGRMFPDCKSTALGQVLNGGTGNGNPFGPMGFGVPPYSPLGLGMNPMAAMAGFQQQSSGMLSNPAVVGMGTTMYSGMIRQMRFQDLLGRSMAACQGIQNGRCMGAIAYCCSITRDSLSAGQVFVEPQVSATTNAFSSFGNQGVNSDAFSPFGNQGGLVGTGGLNGALGPVGGQLDDGNVFVAGTGTVIGTTGDNGLF